MALFTSIYVDTVTAREGFAKIWLRISADFRTITDTNDTSDYMGTFPIDEAYDVAQEIADEAGISYTKPKLWKIKVAKRKQQYKDAKNP